MGRFTIGGCGCNQRGIGGGCGGGCGGRSCGCRRPNPGAPGCCQEAPDDEGLFVPPAPTRARLIVRGPMRDDGLFYEPAPIRARIAGECATVAYDPDVGAYCLDWWGTDAPRTVATMPTKAVPARIVSPPRIGRSPNWYSRHKATFLEYPAMKARVGVVPGRRR